MPDSSRPGSSVPVTIVSFDPSSNALGRPLLFADLLKETSRVSIVGVSATGEIWAPARSSSIPIATITVNGVRAYPRAARWLRDKVAGSRVIVHKPLATSLGLALAAGVQRDDMLLDIDDWELGLYRSHAMASLGWLGRAWKSCSDLLDPGHLNAYPSTLAFDWLSHRIPQRIVSNHWLARRFGGRVLPHVRDTSILDPDKVDAIAERARLQMNDRVWVGFIGTMRSHKGLDDLVLAMGELIGSDAPGLFLAGADRRDSYVTGLIERASARLGPERLRVVDSFDFVELPKIVCMPDIICIPSRDEPGAHGQIPAKLFDAMAMAKAVVVTRVNDMADIVGEAGVVIEPGNVAALSRALSELSRTPERRTRLGLAARERAIEQYSYAAGRRTLLDALEPVQAVS